MKKSFLTLLAFLPFFCFGQVKKSSSTLTPIIQVFNRDALQYGIDVLTKAELKTLDVVSTEFDKELLSSKTNSIVKKHKGILKQLIKDTKNMTGISSSYFHATGSGLNVYGFNNQITLALTGLTCKNIYNTATLTASERSAKVAREVLLPSLSELEPLLVITEVANYSLSVGYIAADFDEDIDSAANRDGEILGIIISKSVLKKYLSASITEDEVFKLASFYSSNGSNHSVRKILIK